MAKDYDYSVAGFDDFMNRSIDNVRATNLDSTLVNMPYWMRLLPAETVQTSGSLGDKLQIGNIVLDGASGRISVYDQNSNEVIRLGTL